MIVETRRRTQNPDNSSRKQTVELQSREGKHKTRLIDKELKVAVRPQLKMVHILNRIHSIKEAPAIRLLPGTIPHLGRHV
jgi:hypothetical protein